MASRETLISIIKSAYDARCQGDKAAFATFMAPDSHYRLVSSPHVLPGLPLGPADAVQSVSEMIDRFTFHSIEHMHLIVEGDRVAVHSKVDVSTPGGERLSTELFDLWTFDDCQLVTSIVQFADTGLIARVTGSPARAG